MKKGEFSDWQKAQETMRQVFAKIQNNPSLHKAYQQKTQSIQEKNQSISAQLVTLAMQLDHYMKNNKHPLG